MLVFGLKSETELRIHHISMFSETLMMQAVGNMVAQLFVDYPAVQTIKVIPKYVGSEGGRLAVDKKIRLWLEENRLKITGVGYSPATKQQVALFSIARIQANYGNITAAARLKNDGKNGSLICFDMAMVLSNEFPTQDKVPTSTMLAEIDDETSIHEVEKVDLRGPILLMLINYSMLSSKWRQADFKLNDLDISLADILLHKDSVLKSKVTCFSSRAIRSLLWIRSTR